VLEELSVEFLVDLSGHLLGVDINSNTLLSLRGEHSREKHQGKKKFFHKSSLFEFGFLNRFHLKVFVHQFFPKKPQDKLNF
jgi:hypothetical protein